MTTPTRDIPELADEVEWENNMINRGMERFLAGQEDARENGRGDEALAERRMLTHYIKAVAEGVEEFTQVTQYSHDSTEKQVLRALPPLVIAMLTLKVLLSDLHLTKRPLASAAQAIGARIEDELLMEQFHASHTAYFEEIMRKLDDKQSYDRKFKKKSIAGSMRNQQGAEYTDWSTIQRYKVGQRLIHIASSVCDLFEIHTVATQVRGGSFIRPTQECLDWIKNFDDEMSMMFPDRMPMLIPPEPWTNAENGGYITAQLRKMTPLIIKSPIATAHSKKWLAMYNTAKMPTVLRSINALQDTTWRVNEAVMRVLQQVLDKNLGTGIPPSEPYTFPNCPLTPDQKPAEIEDAGLLEDFSAWKSAMRTIHELESERRAKIINVARTFRMAKEMAGRDFWFVYRADFRGRLYCATSGLSPQGTEIAKALLKFGEGKRLGQDGWFWFQVSGANRYGKDKIGFEDRIGWIASRSEEWQACATDPIGNRHIWGEADEPYQFLAWCIEYTNAITSGNPENFKSYLPIGMDGSCNGLQHFSAMLNDRVGGSAVNLMPGELPTDIYQRVADVMTGKLRAMSSDSEAAMNWLSLFASLGLTGAPRKLTKPPVMTLPYGSTERSCTDSIMQWYSENAKDFFPKATAFKHALFLTPLLWSSIGDVVIAARAAMTWIRQCAGIVARSGSPLIYVSPLGFPVKQQNEKTKSEILTTYLSGRLRVTIETPTGELDSLRMQNGSSPNFVHHCDAVHMMMTINAMIDAGITSFAMIHDDYGTHAADIAKMHQLIREQFVVLYTGPNMLVELHRQLERNAGVILPPPPIPGDLDVTQVLQSAYFFS